MNPKWNSEKIIQFLQAYEQYPCLWDVNSSSYKNRDDRMNAYAKISSVMGIDGFGIEEVKAKIRSIRNAYTLELGKISKSKKSGAATGDIYKPKVAWFLEADRILNKVVQMRETQSTEIISEGPTTLTDVEINAPETYVDEAVIRSARPPAHKIKMRRQTGTEKALEELHSIVEKLNNPPRKEEDDEYDSFGRTVALKLKKLPESAALESMAYIQAYLVQQRLKSHKQTQHHHPYSRPSTSSSEYSTVSNLSSDADILYQAVSSIMDHENYC